MFIAMNRFAVRPEGGEAFERSWRERETYLAQVPGFVHFALLKGDTPGEYVSHSTWAGRAAFEAWASSDVFKKAHGGRDSVMGLLTDHPRVSLYEVVLEEPAPSPVRED